MQLDKNDVIRIRAAALKSLKDSGLRERALAGSKHHDDFIYCEKEFINLFSDAMDGLNTQTSIAGIELIAQERREQIEKHHRTVDHDLDRNMDGQLIMAALATVPGNDWEFPAGWDLVAIQKICDKEYIQRLAVAGAFIAAEIDRLQATEGKQEGGGQ